MSTAFIREQDAGVVEEFPDRPVSQHPNDVTERGMVQIDDAAQKARRELAAAQAEGDTREIARALRDVRYWSARQSTARVLPLPTDNSIVRFGSKVAIARDDGREQTFRIVGEDEADPSQGTISHASPLARNLLGKKVGEAVRAGRDDAEIISIG
jgi:transcription elongation GreA/GreB family factor